MQRTNMPQKMSVHVHHVKELIYHPRNQSRSPSMGWGRRSMGWVLAAAVALTCMAAPTASEAVSLRPDIESQCARATVKIVALGDDGQGRTGSGVMLDSRGYFVTSFRLVGNTGPGNGAPGSLFNPDNRYYVATVRAAGESARPQWIAAVVRTDPALDLALLRIITDTNGRRVDQMRFGTLRTAPMGAMHNSTSTWSLGFPNGSRSLAVRKSGISRVLKNSLGQPSWLRLSSSVDSGLSGGPLVNRKGQLLGLPSSPIVRGRLAKSARYARAAVRIPSQWKRELSRGHLRGLRAQGLKRLDFGTPVLDATRGDDHPGETPTYYYAIGYAPSGTVLTTTPNLPLKLVGRDGKVWKSGKGQVQIPSGIRVQNLVAAVQVPKDASKFSLLLESPKSRKANSPFYRKSRRSQRSSTKDSPSVADMNTNPDSTRILLPPKLREDVENPFFTAPSRRGARQSPSRGFSPQESSPQETPKNVATVSGKIVDAVTGRPISGATFVVARRDINVRRHVGSYLAGRISESSFRKELVGVTRTDLYGRFRLRNIPRNGRFPAAAIAPGYEPSVLSVRLHWHNSNLKLGSVELRK